MKRNKQKSVHQPVGSVFERKQKLFLYLTLITGTLMSILLFDVKPSLGGDDCDYVMFADRFCHDFTFPGFRGPLYPIVLSPLILVFGVNLTVLKLCSAIFILLSIWLLYKSFAGKIRAVILMPALLLASICPYLFFYASYTYSEPFFMFVQSLFIYFFSKYFLDGDERKYTLRHDWKKYLILGFLILAMGLTRSIGFGVLGAIVLFFSVKRRWKDMLFTLSAAAIALLSFQIFKALLWHEAGSAYDLKYYLAKNYYNINQGMEDFAGFVNRLVVNSNVYLSKFLCLFMGLRSEDTVTLSPVLTVLIYIFFAVCLISVFRKNLSLFFIGLYVSIMNFASFVILQSNWMQDRLIVVYYPLIILFFLGGLFYLFMSDHKFRYYVYVVTVAILFAGNLSHDKIKIERHLPVLQQNLKGNQLAGLTPDWQNFILMSQWANKNINKNAKIASRKPSISYIYTGREFEGIFSVPTVPVDSLPVIAPQGKSVLIVGISQAQLQLAPNLQYLILENNQVKFDGLNDYFVGLYFVDNDKFDEITSALQTAGVKYSQDIDKLKKACLNQNNVIYIYNPDQLLQNIENKNIKYLLLASIRATNTGIIINTLHNYVEFIEMKYPNRFITIYTTGNTEPCKLVEYAPNGIRTKLGNF